MFEPIGLVNTRLLEICLQHPTYFTVEPPTETKVIVSLLLSVPAFFATYASLQLAAHGKRREH